MKRVTYEGVRYEVELKPKLKVKNTETCGYIRTLKDKIASLDDETVKLVVRMPANTFTEECWTVEEALSLLHRYKFKWVSADLFINGSLLNEVVNQNKGVRV